MTDPGLALESAMLKVLRADKAIRGFCDKRVFDVVPDGPVPVAFPYLEFGDDQVVAAPAEGQERAVEIYATLHAWSRLRGRPEVKKLCGAVVDAIATADLTIPPDLRLVLLEHQTTKFLADPDGVTSHGVVTFRALVDPA